MTDQPEFDIIVFGATGFTGRLVAEHLQREYPEGTLRWAIAGRNPKKLDAVRSELGLTVPTIVADSHDRAALDQVAARTRTVCSTVGPYALHGSELVAACVEAGTSYCDITGEVQWIRRMIDTHQARAEQTGATIVHCCGFDSIPSDLGTLFLVNAIKARGKTPASVKYLLKGASGSFSGGTAASLLNVLDEAKDDKALRRQLADPYSLNPEGERKGPDSWDQRGPEYDQQAGAWTAPFVMAAINTRIVRRSNALLDYAYGRDFRYGEATWMGTGLKGRASAYGMSAAMGGFMLAAAGPTRGWVKRFLPKAGEGPDAAAREKGFFNVLMMGHATDGTRIDAKVTGDRDPGYGSTSRMLGESAVCLSTLTERPGGFWTPASVLGGALIERLEARAGLSFNLA